MSKAFPWVPSLLALLLVAPTSALSQESPPPEAVPTATSRVPAPRPILLLPPDPVADRLMHSGNVVQNAGIALVSVGGGMVGLAVGLQIGQLSHDIADIAHSFGNPDNGSLSLYTSAWVIEGVGLATVIVSIPFLVVGHSRIKRARALSRRSRSWPAEDSDASPPPRETCRHYIRLRHITYPAFLATYGPDGSCWKGDQALTSRCAQQCTRMLSE